MRERHNIVGSEVGHARPPIYFKAAVRRRPRPRRGRFVLAVLVLAVISAGGALAYLDRLGVGEAYRQHDVWPIQERAED
jgi:hypothetical protein